MGCKCWGTKSREEDEGERKSSCLRCCAPRKKKNNKGRRNWNPFTCLKCRGKKVTCCSSSCCSNKPSETGNGKNKSSADIKELKESRQNIPHGEKKNKKRKFRRGSCLPCLVCGGESGCCGRFRGCCGWKQGCCAKSTEDNNINSNGDGNNITPTDVSNIKSSAENNIRSSDVNIRLSAENNIRPTNVNIRPSTENNIRPSDMNIRPSADNNIRPSNVNIRSSTENNIRPSDVKNIKPTMENTIKPSDANNNSKPSDARKVGEKKNCLTCFACKGSKPSDARKEEEKKNCLTCFACKGKMLRSCFYCAKSSEENKISSRKKEPRKGSQLAFLVHSISFKSDGSKHRTAAEEILRIGNGNIAARVFQFRELAAATKNFRAECLLGEGGFGRVYQGKLEDTNQIVAVKQLDRNGFQGNREFLVEVLMLSLLHHSNLVKLLGYCADGDQRILVYEYMPLGSLEDLLAPSPNREPLDWNTRMKIALGSAKGLEYLHDIANPPVIYRDFKTSNILLDDEYNPKLSDFGLAKLGPIGDKNYVSTRVMGTYGYCAPEYALTGQLTKMSDIYSFGVVFLEIITGRKAIDITKPTDEQQLVHWAGPLFKDKTKFVEMADPLLQGKYPLKGLYQALAVASMCLQDEANIRPRISDVVTALEYLAIPSGDPNVGLKESTPIEVATLVSATPVSALETNTDGIEEMNDKEKTLQTQSNREDEIQMEVDIT